MELEPVIAGALERALFELLRSRLVKTVPVTSPAAGVDWSTAVPSGEFWEVQAVSARLSDSAVVGNRQVGLLLGDGSTTWARIGSPGNDAASTTNDHTWLKGFGAINSVNGADGFDMPFPWVLLPPGTTIGTNTVGKDVGDQWDRIVLNVVAWEPRKVLLAADWLRDHVR